jgi:hypothetical protein
MTDDRGTKDAHFSFASSHGLADDEMHLLMPEYVH